MTLSMYGPLRVNGLSRDQAAEALQAFELLTHAQANQANGVHRAPR